MSLMRITDFKSRPSIVEYLTLYATISTFIVLGSASLLGNLSNIWALISFAVLLISAAVLNMLKQIRHERAVAFYKEWLNRLSRKEISALMYRLKDQCPEKKLIQRNTR